VERPQRIKGEQGDQGIGAVGLVAVGYLDPDDEAILRLLTIKILPKLLFSVKLFGEWLKRILIIILGFISVKRFIRMYENLTV